MKIGIVCPYSFDAPGGVQAHITDLTEELSARGHHVSVLAPGTLSDGPGWLTTTGRSVPIKFNGSVARLAFGPGAANKTRKWLEEGDFDVLHIHEPGTPSLGMLALRGAETPTVGTFHSAMDRSRIRSATSGLVAPLLERLSARIAVSGEAHRTLTEHHGGDSVIIPNGVFTDTFKNAEPDPRWAGSQQQPTIVFLGRLDEPRKGLPVFIEALPAILAKHPQARILVAGRGHSPQLEGFQKANPDNVEILGEISDAEKAGLLRGATVYVAPQTGGESFGIVLVEGMAAGASVVASDIPAFRAVLDEGKAGALFRNGSGQDLARTVNALLADPARREELATAGARRAAVFDWGSVATQILAVYEAVIEWGASQTTGTLYEGLRDKFSKGNNVKGT